MDTYIMLTRLAPGAAQTPQALKDLERKLMEAIRAECPQVAWKASYAVLADYDYVDIFTAPDMETATRVRTLVETVGQGQAEVWGATEWRRFKDLVTNMPGKAA